MTLKIVPDIWAAAEILYALRMDHSHSYNGWTEMLIMLRSGYFHILMPKVWTSFLNAGLVYAFVLFIFWLNVSSHRSFSLPCQLICCWLGFHLHFQSQTCPQGSVTSSLPVYSGVIKNLPCINIPISVLCGAPTGSLAAKEPSDHLRIWWPLQRSRVPETATVS